MGGVSSRISAGWRSEEFLEARAERVEAGTGVREQGRMCIVHGGCVLMLRMQVAHAKA